MKLTNKEYNLIIDIIDVALGDIKQDYLNYYRDITNLDNCDNDDMLDYLIEMVEENNDNIEDALIYLANKFEHYKRVKE